MSVIGWNGRELKILVAGLVIAAVRTKRVSHAADSIDLSEGEDDGFRHLDPQPDTRSVEVSVEGVATVDNWRFLIDEWYGNFFTDVEIQHPDGSIETPEDGAFLRALDHTGEYKGHVAFSATFLLSGLVTRTGAGNGGNGGGGNGNGNGGDNPGPDDPFNPLAITAIDPEEVDEDGPTFNLSVFGTGFVHSSVIRLDGADLATTYISATELEATVLADAITEDGPLPVRVFNPAPGGGLSNAIDLEVLGGMPPEGSLFLQDHVITSTAGGASAVFSLGPFGRAQKTEDLITSPYPDEYIVGTPGEFIGTEYECRWTLLGDPIDFAPSDSGGDPFPENTWSFSEWAAALRCYESGGAWNFGLSQGPIWAQTSGTASILVEIRKIDLTDGPVEGVMTLNRP
jgi:hypothetical protein